MAHELPIDNTTYRAFVEKLGASDPQEFVGNPGDIFWNPNDGEINISDGKTAGGVGLKTRRLDITTRYIDQFQWVQTFFNGDQFQYDNNYDYGSGIAVGSDGYGYLIGGNDNDGYPYVVKFAPDSNPYNLYDEARYLDNTYGYTYGEAIAVHKDSENGDSVYALCYNGSDLLLVKLDDGLSVQWSSAISSTNGGDVVTDAEGNVYVVGWSWISGGNKLIVAKYAADGTLLWDGDARRIGDYSGNRAFGVSIDGSNLYIVGRTTDAGVGGADVFVVKLNTADGSTVWQKTLGQPESYAWEYGYGIAAGKTGVYITADARDPVYNERSSYVAKLTKEGALVWQKYIANFYYDSNRGQCVVVDEDDNVYMTGEANYPNLADPETNGNTRDDLILAKFDKDGNLQYQRAVGQTGDDYSWYDDSHHNLAIDGDFLWLTGYSYLRAQGGESIGFVARIGKDENEGIYGEYIIQPTNFEVGNSNLVLGDANLENTTSGLSISSASVTDDYPYDYTFAISFRAPFDLNMPGGTVTAKVVRAKEIRLGDIPIKSSRPYNPYNWEGHNLYIGENAGFASQEYAYHNIVIGKYSGVHNTYGSNNIFLGKESGYYNTTGYRNLFIGHSAGYDNTTGSYNLAIGDGAGGSLNEGSNNVIIGNADVYNGNDNYQLAIGQDGTDWIKGDSTGSVRIPGYGAALELVSENGTVVSLTVDNSGNLLVNGNALQFA